MKKAIILSIMVIVCGVSFADEVCFKHPTKADAVVCCMPTQAVTINGTVTGCTMTPLTVGQTVAQMDAQILSAQKNVENLQARKVKAVNALK